MTLLAVALAACSAPELTVINDLDFTIALDRCEGKNALDDPVLVAAGKEKRFRPRSACVVTGPASKSGFLNAALNPGPYLGCLLLPPKSERAGARLKISTLNRDISSVECDETL